MRKERKQWHKLLDQILDLSEFGEMDANLSDESKTLTYEEYIDRDDKTALRAYQVLLGFSKLSHLVEGELMALNDALRNHHQETRLTKKEGRVYNRLLGKMITLDTQKYPSRVKAFHTISNKISSVEDKRNFIAFCIDHNLPLHIPHATDIADALRRLNDGQTSALLKASNTGKWRTNITAIRQLKFLAICNVSILMGINKSRKKYEATSKVAEYYGCSEDTISQWAKRDMLNYYPKEFLKKIHPILMEIGALGFKSDNDDKVSLLKEWVESQVYFEEDPGLFLWHFFMNRYGNHIGKCGELYKKALRATDKDREVSISGYNELIRSLHILTNAEKRPLIIIDDLINKYT